MGLILDTSFLVFAEREARRGVPGRADAFLAQRPSDTFFITFTVAGELACGQSANVRGDWERLFQLRARDQRPGRVQTRAGLAGGGLLNIERCASDPSGASTSRPPRTVRWCFGRA